MSIRLHQWYKYYHTSEHWTNREYQSMLEMSNVTIDVPLNKYKRVH